MAETEVEMPDGTVLAFPEGMSQQDMQSAASKYWQQNQPADHIGSAIASPPERDQMLPSPDNDTRSTAELLGTSETGGMDQMRRLSAPMFEGAAQAWRGATGEGPSVVGSMLSYGINTGYGNLPVSPRVANVLGRTADFGLAALSGIGGVGAGLAGAIGDGAEAIGVPGADRLGRELAALPEAFAGSPTMFAGIAPRVAQVVPDARKLIGGPVNQPITPARVTSQNRTTARPTTARPTTAPAPMGAAELGENVRRAGSGNRRAQRRVAGEVNVDQAASASANRLNMDLPPDVLSNNQLIKESAGLTRSIAGTPASAGWRDTVVNAAERATEAMRSLGGSTDLSAISADVRNSLRGTQEQLGTQASKLYNAVDGAVPRSTIIEPNNTVRALNEILGELGGEAGMSIAEQKLFRMATGDQPVTYERLMREKRAVQRALRTRDGPYADADDFLLRRIESALVSDQLDNVERIGGSGLRGNLEMANNLTRQKKELEGSIVGAFGRDGEGSIANSLRTAVSSASKGDVGGLNRILNVVPQELRADAVATAISTISQSARAAEPGFGFAEFAKVYRGLRSNSDVYKRITTTMGPDADRTMRDLYNISRRITDARANVLTTGKANQALMEGMTAEGLVMRVLDTSLGRNVVRAGSAGAGAVVGGPVGAGTAASAAETVMRSLTNKGASQLDEASRMFASPEFRAMVTEAAVGTPSPVAVNRVAKSPAFRTWAQAARVENPVVWLEAAILGAAATQLKEPEQAEAAAVP